MKLTSYSGSFSSSGATSTASNGLAIVPNMYGDAGKNLNSFSNALGTWADVIKKKQDEADQQAAFNAINDYNKKAFSMMYEGDNALMNMTGSNAANISQAYMQGENEIRAGVLDNVKFYNPQHKQALQNMLDKQAFSHYQTIGRREYQQQLVAQKDTLNLAGQNAAMAMQKNYADAETVATHAGFLSAVVDGSFNNMSPEEKLMLKRQTLSNYYGVGIQAAMNANDDNAYNSLMEKAKPYLTPEQYEKYNKVHTAFVNDETMRKSVRAAVDGNKTWDEFERELRAKGVTEPGGNIDASGSIQQQAAAAAKYVESKTGIPAKLVYAQWRFESFVEKGFDSPLAKQNNNFGGLTQSEPNGEKNKQPEPGATNYYKEYGSMQEYADDYINSFIKYYKFNPADIKTPEDFAKLLHREEYFTGNPKLSKEQNIANYAGGIASGVDEFDKYYNPSQPISSGGGTQKRPYTEKEIDQYRNMYNAYQNQRKHEKTVADLMDFKNTKNYVFENFINRDGGMAPLDEAIKWARDSAGGDLDKAKKNMQTVTDWYKIYGVNTTGGGGAKIDKNKFDDVLVNGGFDSIEKVRGWCASRGFNATTTNWAIDRWQKHFERKGEFSLDMKDLKELVVGKSNNLSPAEKAKWAGAQMYIREEAAKIEVQTGRAIDSDTLAQLAKKAGEEKVYGGGFFPEGSLMPYKSGTKMSFAMARRLGYKLNPDYKNPGAFYVENPDGTSTWLQGEKLAQEIDEKAKAIYGK